MHTWVVATSGVHVPIILWDRDPSLIQVCLVGGIVHLARVHNTLKDAFIKARISQARAKKRDYCEQASERVPRYLSFKVNYILSVRPNHFIF
jgi:hypothetical protein